MKPTDTDEYEVIERAVHRLVWAEQKQFSQLLLQHAVTLPQFFVLLSIKRRGAGCPIGALAEEMLQSYPTMTGIVDRLEEAKLVVRDRAAEKDRRKVIVRLTPRGSHLLERANQAQRQRMIRAFARFSVQDRREFLRLLMIYLETLEKEPV